MLLCVPTAETVKLIPGKVTVAAPRTVGVMTVDAALYTGAPSPQAHAAPSPLGTTPLLESGPPSPARTLSTSVRRAVPVTPEVDTGAPWSPMDAGLTRTERRALSTPPGMRGKPLARWVREEEAAERAKPGYLSPVRATDMEAQALTHVSARASASVPVCVCSRVHMCVVVSMCRFAARRPCMCTRRWTVWRTWSRSSGGMCDGCLRQCHHPVFDVCCPPRIVCKFIVSTSRTRLIYTHTNTWRRRLPWSSTYKCRPHTAREHGKQNCPGASPLSPHRRNSAPVVMENTNTQWCQ